MTGNRDLLKNATKYHLSSALDSWDSIAPVAKSKLSVFVWSGTKILEEVKTDIEVTAVFSELKYLVG